MARTLLSLVQQACNEIGIPEPLQLFGSQNDAEKQLLALAQREGKDFASIANKNGGWQELRTDYTFTTVAGQAAYDLPSDLEYFVFKTFWDDQYKWELIPISAQEKQVLRYGIVGGSIRNKFYIRGDQMYLDPVPESAFVIAYDYYSNAWCQSDASAAQSRWAADTDTYKLDEDCFIQGIKWRFLRMKGLDYTQEFADYTLECQRVIARDGGSRQLSLNGKDDNYLLNCGNCPETGYGE